jgi:hypothetical protein
MCLNVPHLKSNTVLPTLPVLAGLVKGVRSLPAPLNITVRNQGGGAWNHALYFKVRTCLLMLS